MEKLRLKEVQALSKAEVEISAAPIQTSPHSSISCCTTTRT